MELLRQLLQEPLIHAAGAIVGSFLAAWLIELVITKILSAAASKTKTDVDDKIVDILRRPIFLSVLIYGLDWSVDLLSLPERLKVPIDALLKTLIIVTWAIASTRIGAIVLTSLAARESKRSMLQPRTLPVFDILMRIVVVAGAIYAMFLAWEIDLTAWLASAGILGVAFGFAAKDTLANLFAGIFILADAPYKVRDWIVLNEQLRGEVTHIGMRSTRLLTPDDVEINVPNAVIGNAQLLNETSGPYRRQRVRIKFAVVYGSDVDAVREIVLACTNGSTQILTAPEAAAPKIRLRALSSSGLEFELSVWIEDPTIREAIVDDMTTRVYKALTAANIEIPYPKRDIYIKEMPR
ncbi:MAG TPA: mechanosensitive ion channel family protein [Enhygromyxa sp.]|nr:mechanosensitive ion channel family protein [Enhygromyxa sp.]